MATHQGDVVTEHAGAELKAANEVCRAFARQHLQELAGEVLGWHTTGELQGGRLRELAGLVKGFADESDAISIAERMVNHEALAAATGQQNRAEVTRTVDEIDCGGHAFICSFADGMTREEKAFARVEGYRFEQGCGGVEVLWVKERLKAVSVVVRDRMNWTVCTKVTVAGGRDGR